MIIMSGNDGNPRANPTMIPMKGNKFPVCEILQLLYILLQAFSTTRNLPLYLYPCKN